MDRMGYARRCQVLRHILERHRSVDRGELGVKPVISRPGRLPDMLVGVDHGMSHPVAPVSAL